MIKARAFVSLIWVMLAGLSVLGGTVGAAPAQGAIPLAATSSPKRLELTLTKVSPAAVNPKDDLVVTGTARNPGSKPIKDAAIRLRLHSQPLDTRTEIDDWLSRGEVAWFDRTLPRTAKLPTVPPGGTVRFKITVPAGTTGLPTGSSAFGPRGIALEARVAGAPNGSDPIGLLRSTFVWNPTDLTSRTKLSILVPITTTVPSTRAGEPTSDVAVSVLPGGRLRRVLSATADPAIGWAIDPAVLASVQRLGTNGISKQSDSAEDDGLDDPTKTVATSGSSSSSGSGSGGGTPSAGVTGVGSTAGADDAAARQSARTWLAEFEAGQPARTVLELPFADPDLTSVLTSSKGLTLLRRSDALGKAVTQQVLGTRLDTRIAWPGDGTLTPTALTALGKARKTAVLLPSQSQPPDPDVGYTPSGHSSLRGAGNTLDGLLYDEQLSSLLTASGGEQSAASIQTMLAQLAAITKERPSETRQVLAVAPRTWNPNPAGVQTLMTALHDAAWVNVAGLSSLRRAPGPTRADPSYSRTATKHQLPVGAITGALAMSRNLDAFGSALTDPSPILQPLREQVASLLSLAWRRDRRQLSSARQEVADNVNQVVGGVRLLVGTKKKLFTARSAPIQMTVVNDTSYPVKVVVRLKPQSGQLTFARTKVFTAPPNQRTPTLIPARAIANGNVTVEAVLLTQDGRTLGASHTFLVRVRPNWESRGMVVAGGFLGILLVIGLLRGIRRRRPSVPLDAVPDVDDLANRRADEAAHTEEARVQSDQTDRADRAPQTEPPQASQPEASQPETEPPQTEQPQTDPVDQHNGAGRSKDVNGGANGSSVIAAVPPMSSPIAKVSPNDVRKPAMPSAMPPAGPQPPGPAKEKR